MKHFLIKLFLILLSTWLCFEVVLRWFDLARYTIPTDQIGNNCMLKPGYSGLYVGGGFGEIQAKFTINSQGWNSTEDFNLISDSQTVRVALIGDSYVEGTHVDVENSIGRQLDRMTHNKTITHEYGRSGANIEDFNRVYNSFVKGKYDYVFVLLRDGNLNATSATFMNCGCSKEEHSSKSKGMIRSMYSHSAVLSYLNINQFLTENVQNMIKKIRENFSYSGSAASDVNAQGQTKVQTKQIPHKENQVDWDFGPEVIILYEKKLLNKHEIIQKIPEKHVFLAVNHNENDVLDFGFDRHWNSIGRKDCAITMFHAIRL